MAASDSDSKVVDLEDLNPEFRRRLGNFLTSAKKSGIPAHIIEAYRDRAVQEKYYADKLKGLRPYPVAKPGTSFHEGGYASDILADDRASQQKLINYANAHPEFGIAPLPGDAPHFQIAGYKHLADAVANPPKLGEGSTADLSQFVSPAFGYSVASGYNPGTTMTTAAAPRSGFLDSLSQIESNNQNIFSGVDKDYPNQPGSRSQGYYQIDTPTWQQFAAKAGVDISKYPSAMNAPQEVQAQVASLIPLSRFGARTQRMLGQQYGQLDTGKTVGELAASVGQGGGITAIASAAPAAPAAPTFGEAAAKGDVGGMFKSLITKPPPKTDDKGNPVEQKSPLENVASAFGSKGGEEKGPAQIPEMQPMAPVQDPTPGLAPAAQQLWASVAQASAQPLTWNSEPYGSKAGLQRIRQGGGTTLNNTGYGYNG